MQQAKRNLSSSFRYVPVKRTSTGYSDSPESGGKIRKGTFFFDPNSDIVMPENITAKQLKNVADRNGGKIYNAHIGTTCHQCRYCECFAFDNYINVSYYCLTLESAELNEIILQLRQSYLLKHKHLAVNSLENRHGARKPIVQYIYCIYCPAH